jgi:hypothetical protein
LFKIPSKYKRLKLKLLEDHKELGKSRTPRTTSNSIPMANILKKMLRTPTIRGNFLLEESKKVFSFKLLQKTSG